MAAGGDPPRIRSAKPYGSGRVYQRYRIWWLAYSHQGRLIRESSQSEDRGVAERLLRERLAALQRFPQLREGPNRVQLRTLLDLLLAEYAQSGRASLATARGHVRQLEEAFRDVRVAHLTKQQCIAVKDAWLAEGKAPATINRYFTTMKRALSLGRAEGLVFEVPPIPRLAEDNVRQGFYSVAWLDAVRGAMPDTDLFDAIEWAFFSGMRKGEVRALRWDWFDAETWTLRLPAKPNSKRRRGRVLALRGHFRTIIERRLARRVPHSPYVFHRFGGRPLGDFRKAWRRALATAGLPQDTLFHDLRRTGVRNLLRAGNTKAIAKRISGHVTDSMCDRYDIIDEADLAAAAERVTAYVDDIRIASQQRPETTFLLRPSGDSGTDAATNRSCTGHTGIR